MACTVPRLLAALNSSTQPWYVVMSFVVIFSSQPYDFHILKQGYNLKTDSHGCGKNLRSSVSLIPGPKSGPGG